MRINKKNNTRSRQQLQKNRSSRTPNRTSSSNARLGSRSRSEQEDKPAARTGRVGKTRTPYSTKLSPKSDLRRRLGRERLLRQEAKQSARLQGVEKFGKPSVQSNQKKSLRNPDGNLVRLHKFMAQSGVTSRRKAEDLIREGKVRVNGQLVTERGVMIDPTKDRVQVKNKFIALPELGVVLFNKPKGVVSTLSDPEGRPCIGDYITKHYKSYFPVGRLDWETTGLLVLTNDGQLADHLMHPRYELPRTYHARVEGSLSLTTVAKIKRGINLTDGVGTAQIKILLNDEKSTWIEIVVKEGRNRFIRRLMERVGHQVLKLKRVLHGPFALARLQPGEMRKLSQEEYQKMREKILG